MCFPGAVKIEIEVRDEEFIDEFRVSDAIFDGSLPPGFVFQVLDLLSCIGKGLFPITFGIFLVIYWTTYQVADAI